MKIKQLREILNNIDTTDDNCELVRRGSDHSYDIIDIAGLIYLVDEQGERLSDWYDNPQDFESKRGVSYKTVEGMKRGGLKLVKGLLIE